MKKKRMLPYIVLILVCLFLILPLLITGIYSFARNWDGLLPSDFTLDYYGQVFYDRRFIPSVIKGIGISLLPILISNVFVILSLYTAIAYYPGLEKYIQAICMIPNILKGIILAIPVLALYAGKGGFIGNRIVMLTFVYCVVILPYVYNGIRNNLHGIHVNQLLEAAQILGADKLYAFMKIIVPNMVTGIMVSSLLSMSIIFGDFAIVKIVAGSKFITVQQLLYNNRTSPIQYQSAVVLIMFVVTFIISGAAFLYQNHMDRKINKSHE